MPYEYLDEVTRADIAFRAREPTLERLFIACADATMNVMVEELGAIQPVVEKEINLQNDSLEMLLFDLLQELVYFKDAEGLLLRVPQLQIDKQDDRYVLQSKAKGEKLDPDRHHPRVDVKAVTLHRFSLKKTDEMWEALVVLDI